MNLPSNVLPFPKPLMIPVPEDLGTMAFLQQRWALVAAEEREDWVLGWENGLCIAMRGDGILTIGGVEEAHGFVDGKDLPFIRNAQGEPARLQHRPAVVQRELQRLDKLIAMLGPAAREEK